MRKLTAIECRTEEGQPELCSPRVGRFRLSIEEGDAVEPGTTLGVLQTLNSRCAVVAPEGVSGTVVGRSVGGKVQYCESLVVLGARQAEASREVSDVGQADSQSDQGLAIRAPIDGIFYCRPSPEDPPFVSPGEQVTSGQTLGLIEVMKTFNPVKLEGASVPAPAVVRTVEVGDQQEVSECQILFTVDPA